MEYWVRYLEEWSTQHQALLTLIGVAATILGTVPLWAKPLRSIISSCWSRIPWRRKTTAMVDSVELRFVPIPLESRCAITKYRNQLITQINTHWYVTNTSKSNTPARLLTAQLLNPRVDHPTARCYVSTARPSGGLHGDVYGPEYDIPSGETRKVSIDFHVCLHLHRPEKPLRVRFAVTDQLEKEHRMPRIPVRTIDITSEQ
jgi:hypothetical protein